MNGFDDEKEVLNELLDDECHELVCGRTGGGKTVFLANKVHSLIERRNSFVVLTPRDDILRKTSDYAMKSGYKVVMLPFNEEIGNKKFFNFSTFIRKVEKNSHDKAVALIEKAVNQLIPEHKQDKDAYWSSAGRNVGFVSLVSLLEADPEHFSLPSAFVVASEAKKKFFNQNGNRTYYLKELVETLDKKSSARILSGSFLQNAEETSGCVQSEFTDSIGFCVKSEGILRAFTRDGFDIAKEINDDDTPFAIYICLSETASPKFYQIASIFLEQLLNHLFTIAEQNGGSLKRPVRFLLDEFSTLSKSFPEFYKHISICRARNVFFTCAVQAVNQISMNFSEDEMKTILNNTGTFVYFAVNDLDERKRLSAECGEKTINYGNRYETVPLIHPNEIGALPVGTALVFIKGGLKKAIVKFPYDEQKFNKNVSVLPERIEDCGEPDLFDYETFFREHKKRENRMKNKSICSKKELLKELLGEEDELTPGRILFENQSLFDEKFIVNVLEIDGENKDLIKSLADLTNLHIDYLTSILRTKKIVLFSKEIADKAVELIEKYGGTAIVTLADN